MVFFAGIHRADESTELLRLWLFGGPFRKGADSDGEGDS